jgi:hypothetical protein
MFDREDGRDPLMDFFREVVHESLTQKLGMKDEDVEAYMSAMLAKFLHEDGIFGIRDAAGNRVESVAEMIAEGDIRLNANTFDREREVHQHIGDFLLFWSGVFPEFLLQIKAPSSRDAMLDVVEQGKYSYGVAGSFDYGPYEEQSQTLRKLSSNFVEYQLALRMVRGSFLGFANSSDWSEGFRA